MKRLSLAVLIIALVFVVSGPVFAVNNDTLLISIWVISIVLIHISI